MQAFKLLFRIILKNLSSISIYLVVFFGMSVLFAAMGPANVPTDFAGIKVKLALLNQDGDAALARGLSEYLGRNAQMVTLAQDRESQQDALFFRETEYILTIPAGFSDSFLKGAGEASLLRMAVPDSMTAVQVEFLINRYLSLARVYAAATPDMDPERLVTNVKGNLDKQAQTQLIDGPVSQERRPLSYYFAYFPYPAMSIMILAITSVMLSFGLPDIRRRNAAAPIPSLHFNLQLVAGSMIFALAVWGILTLAGGMMYAQEVRIRTFLPLAINTLAYTLVCLSLSFLLGYLIKGRNAQAAISNVVALGLCFISGVFVPQEYLGEAVRNIASFTPTYWYVSAVNQLDPSAFAGGATLGHVTRAVLIQLGFAIAFLSIALAISRHQELSGK